MALARDLVPAFPPGQAAANGGQAGTIVAAGSALTDATPVTVSVTTVTGADGNKGVIIPALAPGESCFIFNNSGSTLKVWPASASIAITTPGSGMGTAGAAFSLTTYRMGLYVGSTSTQVLGVLA